MLLPCLSDNGARCAPLNAATLPERVFFFGSLMDVDLCSLVLGRDASALSWRPAAMTGYRRRRARGESFPILVPHPGGRVEGVVVEGLDLDDLDRLQFYETSDYRLAPSEVACGDDRLDAHLFLATDRLEPADEGWELAVWQALEKPSFLPVAAALMDHYGRTPLAEVERRWHEIKEAVLASLTIDEPCTQRAWG